MTDNERKATVWMAQVRAWASSFPQRKCVVDDSRETIYERDHIAKAPRTVEENEGIRYSVRGGQGRTAGQLIDCAFMLAAIVVFVVIAAFIVSLMCSPVPR